MRRKRKTKIKEIRKEAKERAPKGEMTLTLMVARAHRVQAQARIPHRHRRVPIPQMKKVNRVKKATRVTHL